MSGYVDGRESIEKLLSKFQSSTLSTFVIRQSFSAFNQIAADVLKGVEISDLKWSQLTGHLPVAFDDTPFVACGGTFHQDGVTASPWACHGHIHLTDHVEPDSKRKLVQRSRKGDYKAYLKVLRILRLPELTVQEQEGPSQRGCEN